MYVLLKRVIILGGGDNLANLFDISGDPLNILNIKVENP